MVYGAPEVNHLPIQLHVHLVEVPAPLAEPTHPVHPLAPDVCSKQWSEPVPPETHRLRSKIDAALEQQILDVARAEWKPNIDHDHQPDHLRLGVEIPE